MGIIMTMQRCHRLLGFVFPVCALAFGLLGSSSAIGAPATNAKGTSGDKLVFAAEDKLLIIGDSVTDAGRKPAGEGLFDAVGKGWVALVDGFLSNIYPQLQIRVVNKGNSGNNTRDLKKRWQEDVMNGNPQWVAVFIGVNDVWRQFDVPRIKEDAVPLDEYERNLEGLITATLPSVKGMILMTPFYMEPNKSDRMRAVMDRYGAVVKKLATKYKTRFVDTQAAFDGLMPFHYPATIAWDRIHPNHIGTMALARAFLNSVGFDWNLAAK
jgi:lysophospholipase L1-like esterase